jgi:prepilin-type processing-associated H-X9-DG protein
MYLDDNNGFGIPGPPLTADCPLPSSILLRYTKEPALSPGGNSKSVFVCPGDRAHGQEPPKWHAGYPYGPVGSSYYYPYYAYTACSGHTDVLYNSRIANSPRRPDMWPKPTRDMLLCDLSAGFHKGIKDESGVKCVNFLMLDGHVIAGTRDDRMVKIRYYAEIYDNPYSPDFGPGHK